MAAAGVGEDGVQAAVFLADEVRELVHFGFVGDVSADGAGMRPDVCSDFLEGFEVPASDVDERAFLGEAVGGSASDACAGAGDEGDFAFQLHAVFLKGRFVL